MSKFQQYDVSLFNPHLFQDPLAISADYEPAAALHHLRGMLVIRQVEEVVADLVRRKLVKCPCHLGVGQEAISQGLVSQLTRSDKIFGTHRAHGQYLVKTNYDSYGLIAEIFGKVTGCSKGMGGSMHLINPDYGFMGSVPIVGATIPLALGAALAIKQQGKNDIAVCFFGDGASEEGVFHETLNLASSLEVPVLFVCENNLYASHLDIRQRQPSEFISRFAHAHHIENYQVDGNDVLAVEALSSHVIKEMRQTKRPAFIEAFTYRWLGHVGPNADIDVGVRRSQSDLKAWKKRDPIDRLFKGMLQQGFIMPQQFDELQQSVKQEIEKIVQQAQEAPYPDVKALYEHVYEETDYE